MRSQLFGSQFLESQAGERFVLQNERLLKINMDGTEIHARQGSMVAYQGDVSFQYRGAGAMRLLKKVVTGENLQLMKVGGTGDVFLAHDAREIHLVYLEGDSITLKGDNVLAFEPALEWDIKRVKGLSGMLAAGLFNVTFTGDGWIALTAFGTPVVLNVDQPTFADIQSAVAWSTTLETSIRKSDSIMKTAIGRGSGELAQMSFSGEGYVIVQASEGYPWPPSGTS